VEVILNGTSWACQGTHDVKEYRDGDKTEVSTKGALRILRFGDGYPKIYTNESTTSEYTTWHASKSFLLSSPVGRALDEEGRRASEI
jgi:hypothetical protein